MTWQAAFGPAAQLLPQSNFLNNQYAQDIDVEISTILLLHFLKDFIYLFVERGREGEREGEKH